MNNTPDFIIMGAMKCATSTLHEQLAQQPGIFMSEEKEPNFFSDDEHYVQGMEWYKYHFKAARPNELCGESSTHYTKLPTYPHTIERINKHLPDVKLIYVMRHPIDRLVSHYIHEWSMKVISVDINEAIDRHRELIDYSRYSMQLAPYFETFGRERVLPIFFERFIEHKQEELERVCNFIGYKGQPTWNMEFDSQNISTKRMRNNAVRDFLVEVPLLRAIRQQLIPKHWRTWVRSLWTMKKKPEIEPQKLEYLRDIFDEDLAVLSSWLGIELCCDNFKDTVKSANYDWLTIASKK